MSRSIVMLLMIGAVAFACSPAVINAAELPVFVDYDGDGIDDNQPDEDNDGIPDEFEFHGFVAAPIVNLQAANMFSATSPVDEAEPALSKAARFGTRDFRARAMSETRSDFDAGFGSGLGLGGGLGGGGACAGGVCY